MVEFRAYWEDLFSDKMCFHSVISTDREYSETFVYKYVIIADPHTIEHQ